MQMKTENSVEAASAILRTLRHAVPVLLALLIALLAAAPVLADETDEAITDTETVSAEPVEDLRNDYTAVAAQLEAVDEEHGQRHALLAGFGEENVLKIGCLFHVGCTLSFYSGGGFMGAVRIKSGYAKVCENFCRKL